LLAVDKENRLTALTSCSWIRKVSLELQEQALVYIGLDRGEAEVLALAIEKQAQLIVMDERRGRRFAERLGLPTTGTLGILLLAKELQLIKEIAPYLDRLLSSGLFISDDLIATVLMLAGE
jgi:predicted nucleic acid-binding protein